MAYLTNETVFSLTELPGRLAVIGAGPIGCEMAQTFAHFGSEVFLVETTHGILPREDRDAAGFRASTWRWVMMRNWPDTPCSSLLLTRLAPDADRSATGIFP